MFTLFERSDNLSHYFWDRAHTRWSETSSADADPTYVYSNIMSQARRYIALGHKVSIWDSPYTIALVVSSRWGGGSIAEVLYSHEGKRIASHLNGAIHKRNVTHDYVTRTLREWAAEMY